MTVQEALKRGIRMIRLPEWEPNSRIVLPPQLEGGLCGPWAMLWGASGLPDKPVTDTPLPFWRLLEDTCDRYEEWDVEVMREQVGYYAG